MSTCKCWAAKHDSQLIVGPLLDIVGDAYIEGTFYSSGEPFQSSDARLKSNFQVIGDSLEKIDRLTGYTFNMSTDPSGKRHAGVIAQDLADVLPEATSTNADGYLTVAYGNVVSLLIEGIKELNKKVASLSKIYMQATP